MRSMLQSSPVNRHLHLGGGVFPKLLMLCTTIRLQNTERQSACNQGPGVPICGNAMSTGERP